LDARFNPEKCGLTILLNIAIAKISFQASESSTRNPTMAPDLHCRSRKPTNTALLSDAFRSASHAARGAAEGER
jgi:hypothetical protein